MIRFIVNPAAGRGQGALARDAIERAMAPTGQPYDVVVTAERGDATRLARLAADEGVPTVVAVGGDGTAHEVANGLLEAGRPAALGIVPTGSGNDFARALDVPTDVAAACLRLVEGKTRRIDVGRVSVDGGSPRVFLNGVGIGFTAAVAMEARRFPWLRGLPLYVVALFWALAFRFATPLAIVRADGLERRTRVTFVEACNGQWEGGGFHLAPNGDPGDGLLDVIVLEAVPRLAFLRLLPAFINGTHATSTSVETRASRRLEVELERAVPVQADGERIALAARHVVVELQPSALDVVV
jgi:diacylglycerol kinase (ATP)